MKLENKKAFVQYISHEARGPLSVASMGLELHLQDLLAMDKRLCGKHAPDDIEQTAWVRETLKHVEEIVDACSLAENTLSDMLTKLNKVCLNYHERILLCCHLLTTSHELLPFR